MRYLRKNTATRVSVGPFVDKTDGITPEVALTATNEHLTLMVDVAGVPTLVLDANATASGGSNDMVHVTDDDAGYYDLELTAAQTNYNGRACLSVNYVTDHAPVFHEFMIISEAQYDALYGGVSEAAGILAYGTAAAVAASGLTFASGHGLGAGHVGRAVILVVSATTGAGQSAVMTGLAGDVATVSPNWTTTLTGTVIYIVFAQAPATAAQDGRLLAAATVAIIDALTGTGLTIVIGAGTHTTSAVLASDATNGTRLKGRAALVTSGGIVKRGIRFTGDIGASGAFGYTDLYGNAVPAALVQSDVVVVI